MIADIMKEKELPKPTNGGIIVRFEYDKSTSHVKTDTGIFIPERYVVEEADEEAETAWGVTTDRRLINPQVVDIISGEYAGKLAFVHYGAFEVAKWLDENNAIIPEAMILFFVSPIACMPGTYLGEEVFTEGPKTESGIWTTPIAEIKDGVRIKITHTPEQEGISDIKNGDIVITIDECQYDLVYDGKKYIKLSKTEIIGIENQNSIQIVGERVLAEYLPDADLIERTKENDRRAAHRDYINKTKMHISEKYARGLDPDYLDLPEPKFVNAKVIGIGDTDKIKVGDKIIVHRGYGCRLLTGQWIIPIDMIAGIILE